MSSEPTKTDWLHAPLKWAGGKLQVLKHLVPLLPSGDRFVEPFTGSAVVSLNVDYPRYWLSDNNPELIGFYEVVRDRPDDYVQAVKALFIAENNRAEAYEALRAEYNAGPALFRRAVLFLYLNRFGFNGLYRVNKKGIFNVPFGRYPMPGAREHELRALAVRLRAAVFTHSDFESVIDQTGAGDVVYCDPAYVPLSPTANFAAYTSGQFTMADQNRLARAAERAQGRGATVIISNHDTEVTRSLYAAAEVISFEVRRTISQNAQTRGKVCELLAVYPASSAASKRTPNRRSKASTAKTAE
jgi:DNA adenine methylase